MTRSTDEHGEPGVDLAEDVPGLPNFLNVNHKNCWRKSVTKIGPKEQQTPALREKGVGSPTKSNAKAVRGLASINAAVISAIERKTIDLPVHDASAPPKPVQQESAMKINTKTRANPSRPSKTRKTHARRKIGSEKKIRPGSKLEIVAKLLTRSQGCTTADVIAATEWPSVSMPQQAKAAGLVLKKEKDGGITRYKGVRTA